MYRWTCLCVALAACSSVPDALKRPNRIAVGEDGQIWVSDFIHDRIVQFDLDGSMVRVVAEQGIGVGQLWRVSAMALGPDGTLVVANRRPVSDRGNSGSTLELKSFVDGREVDNIVLDGALQDGWVDDIAPGLDPGTWLVVNATDGQLLLIDDAGRNIGTYGGVPRPDTAPSALSRDGRGYWVVEQYKHRVRFLGPDGTGARFLWGADEAAAPRFPTAVGVCPGQWIAVADHGNHRVQRYDLSGAPIDGFSPDRAAPDRPVQLLDLEVTSDCRHLVLADSKGDRVLITTPEGDVVRTLTTW